MKKIILSLLAIGFLFPAFAQTNYIKDPALAIHFLFNDFQTASDIRTFGLTRVLNDKQYGNSDRLKSGVGLSYIQGLSDHVDFAATLSGSSANTILADGTSSGSDEFFIEVAATANLKLLTDKHFFTPFLTVGIGASQFTGHYGAFIPIGVGLQFNIFNSAYILINSQYRARATEDVNYHFYHSFGIAGSIFEKKSKVLKPLPAPTAASDRDGDGIVDSLDKCPDVPGLAALQGCPDKDGDGIADAEDKCPDVAGLAKYQGCPIPDTDGDGINDEVDKCPTVAGFERYQGCPIPDTDGDGVNDEIDKCPTEVGPASNFGCPVISTTTVEKINIAANNIFFATGSSKLLPKSFLPLAEVVKILTDNPSYKLDIDGHTDNTGNPKKNQVLSENRAKSVVVYFVSKGIEESRLIATGFGQDKPLVDNITSKNRAKNRRVEIKARNY